MKRFVEGVRAFLSTKFLKEQGQPDLEDTTHYYSSTEVQRCCGSHRLGDVFEESDSDVVVGREDEVEELVSRLLDDNDESLRVISLIGDEALGSTALARNVYNRLDIRQHFPWRAWIHVSGDLEYKALLHIILKQLPICSLKNSEFMSEEEMHDRLFLVLAEHRFLVVLGDFCRMDVWLKLVRAFADAFNGSRVILTTRDLNVAKKIDPWSFPLELSPLTEQKSWSLFLKKVGREELNNVREEILRICHGLPLAILMLGRLLSTLEFKECSRAIDHLSHQTDQSQSPLSNIIDFSYDQLPPFLQNCFLCLTLFPKAYKIPIRRLLQLWLAEEFVQLSPDESVPEDVAEGYLSYLVCRNMIVIARRKSDGRPKTCCMPIFLYDHFLSKAREKLLVHHCNPVCSSRICIRRSADQFGGISTSESHIQGLSSYLSFDPRKGYKSNKEIGKFLNTIIITSFAMLKVLDLEGVYKPLLPKKLGKLQNLRYLGLRWTGLDTCPKSIGDLPCLETLDLKYTDINILPSFIWKASLRHLYMSEVSIDKPPKVLQDNLQTLTGLLLDGRGGLTYGLNSFTSLRKLGLTCNSRSAEETAICISLLGNLRTLRLRSRELTDTGVRPRTGELVLAPMKKHRTLSNLYLFGQILDGIVNIPRNLITLTLSMSGLREDPMPLLGKLPQLNTLRLFARSYVGTNMTCPSAHFPNLRVLKMWNLERLERWEVEQGTMPQLIELEIRRCENLESSVELQNLDYSLKELILTNMPQDFVEDIRTRMGRGILLTNNWEFSGLHVKYQHTQVKKKEEGKTVDHKAK